MDEDGRHTIKQALDNFQKTIAYVLVFNPKIAEVTLDNNGVIQRYKVLSREQLTSAINILKIQNGENIIELAVCDNSKSKPRNIPSIHLCYEVEKI